MKSLLKTIGVLFILGLFGIPAVFLVLLSLLKAEFSREKNKKRSGRTVLLTGGKMTKCLQLARMFHDSGDRVIVAETSLYKWCGTRFSNAVDQFIIIPEIESDGQSYQRALIDIAQREQVDLFVPVASPKSAVYDANAKPDFPDHTEVFHFDADIVKRLDDKHQFIELSRSFGLSTPESFHIDSHESLLSHQFNPTKKYILKKIDYDPVYRMDLRTLPHDGWEDRVRSLPIGAQEPWVLQEFIEGKEVCTHTTTRDGNLNLYICSNSSPFQVNYEMLDLPNVKEWVRSFVAKLGGTGQISFDFIITKDHRVMPIECNPRTHSAITLFHNQLDAVSAYYTSANASQRFIPNKRAGHTFWFYHELYRLVTSKSRKQFLVLWNRMVTGKEAVFEWNDALPFLFNNHVSIPYQIIKRPLKNVAWEKIDFNIGKLIYQGGD
ncbi:MAG: hypothetical protein WA775_01915 [Psychroserpens sp.]|uniref:hypothetical protein n=1 Tax=Psychroserpens sp. TaxID=2020870 RepID=UPI003C9961A0